jgi:Putative hemolysin
MNLVESEDFKKAANLNTVGGDSLSKLLMYILRFNTINKIYSKISDRDGLEFIDKVIEELELKFEVSPEDLKRIPQSGPFITVSNHPFGGVDGILLIRAIAEIRPDYKMLSNFLLSKIKPLEDFFFPVNPFESKKSDKSSLAGLKLALGHLKDGHCIGVFPAGEVSSYQAGLMGIADRKWQPSALKLIKNANVPVVPIYFVGTNSKLFHLLGLIHPMLRTIKLPSELLNKRNKVIRIRIGNPICVEEQSEFSDLSQYGRFLRAKTYALGTALEVKRFFSPRIVKEPVMVEDIVDPIDPQIVLDEVAQLKKDYLLFQSKNYSVICAPSIEMPNLMTEIGRLREVTFREVGEGTNRKIDIDEFDLYYHQLFIWDDDENKIVGAYRAGKGQEILDRYGIGGFYIQTLFKVSEEFTPILGQCIELGRSFIVKDYQKRPLPLFLLWKGILYFLLKNPEYRFLIGPVSISDRLSLFSKGIIIQFMRDNHYDPEFSKYITPRKKFKVKFGKIDADILLKHSNDINRLDKFIADIEEQDYRMPVLLKKYIKLNGKIIGFNVDPMFNNCLDGLLILDIFQVPIETITSLSKEINDKTILERFNLSDYTFQEE